MSSSINTHHSSLTSLSVGMKPKSRGWLFLSTADIIVNFHGYIVLYFDMVVVFILLMQTEHVTVQR